MSQYLAWAGNGPIPYPPPQPGGTWPGFESFTGAFYSDSDSVRMANDTVRMLVSRVSSTSGLPYANDPAIMAWELANEPRGESDPDSMDMWIDHTSTLIKSLDSNHLVTTGSEGETAHPDAAGNDLVRDHSFAGIDYATAHVWAQNWGWFDPKQGAAGLDDAIGKMRAYVADHFARATQLGKPIVFEEFGLARDGGSYAPGSPTTLRDRYYGEVFSAILGAARAGTPAAGVNFWAWAGEGKPRDPGTAWRSGDTFIGDPPHEMQGWYSVYAEDASTIKVISDAALRTAR
jgi:mannan endo-1,4-beta-mannosidase